MYTYIHVLCDTAKTNLSKKKESKKKELYHPESFGTPKQKVIFTSPLLLQSGSYFSLIVLSSIIRCSSAS
jgi:hypothetical protein